MTKREQQYHQTIRRYGHQAHIEARYLSDLLYAIKAHKPKNLVKYLKEQYSSKCRASEYWGKEAINMVRKKK